jgi:hypothetical protein
MAEIRISAMSQGVSGPSVPVCHQAHIRQRDWPGGGKISVLVMYIGADTIEICPFAPDYIEGLGKNLIALAREERANAKP